MAIFDEVALRTLIADEVRRVIRDELANAKTQDPGDYVSVSEAARIASVATDTVRDWISRGKLGRYNAGRVLRVRRTELDELLAQPAATRVALTPEDEARAYLRRAGRRA
jgi:excisionase family DNA binding protein